MLIPFAFFLGLTIIIGLPTLTYFYAKQMGRNPKLWFFIGILLPGIATIILSLLPNLSDKRQDSASLSK